MVLSVQQPSPLAFFVWLLSALHKLFTSRNFAFSLNFFLTLLTLGNPLLSLT